MCLEPCLLETSCFKEVNIYIDGSNVAYSRYNTLKKPLLSDLLLLLDYLIKELKFKKERIFCICDPALKYNIDKPNEYIALIAEGIIIEAPKVADEFILGFALKHEFCFIISNDRFRNYIDQLPSKQWLEERRITFMIINNEVCLSPNIEYNKLSTTEICYSHSSLPASKTTTLDVVNMIENTEGKLNIF
ncbi:MAG: hypothetical protein ACFFG0_44835 [Candidatus Thorarchaeota archaeon]